MTDYFNDWCDQSIKKFLLQLSFNGYILAGNCVANMIQNRMLQENLDFWVKNRSDYLIVLEEFAKFGHKFNVYQSMVEIIGENIPKINVFFSNMSKLSLIQSFDFDYCRCYWSPKTGVVATVDCLFSIEKKMIRRAKYKNCMDDEIIKAVNNGYRFNAKFWQSHKDMLLHVNEILYGIQDFESFVNIDLNNLIQIPKKSFIFKYDDNMSNINATLEQLAIQISLHRPINLIYVKMLSFNNNNYNLMRKYIKSIVLLNPFCQRQTNKLKMSYRNTCFDINLLSIK